MKKCYSSFRKKNILLLILLLCYLLHLRNNFYFGVQITDNEEEPSNEEVRKSFSISNAKSSSLAIDGAKCIFHFKKTALIHF